GGARLSPRSRDAYPIGCPSRGQADTGGGRGMTGRLPAVNAKRVIRALEQAGFVVDRVVGSHYVLAHRSNPSRAVTMSIVICTGYVWLRSLGKGRPRVGT